MEAAPLNILLRIKRSPFVFPLAALIVVLFLPRRR